MVQYPYFIYIQESQEEAVQDNEGNFESAPPVWILHSNCRDEANGINGSGKKTELVNGENYVYSAVIYLPKGIPIIPETTNIVVTRKAISPSILQDESVVKTMRSTGEIRTNGIIKGFEESRLNVRLWL